MTRTATRLAAAVGTTALTIGLGATPALACTTTDAGGRGAFFGSFADHKGDPGKAFGHHKQSLTLAELQAKLDEKIAGKLAWLDAVEGKVSSSDRLSDDQKTAILAKLQSVDDALTQLRSDIAAATTKDELRTALKESDATKFLFFHGWGHHHHQHFGDRSRFGGWKHDDAGRGGSWGHDGRRDASHAGWHGSSHDGWHSGGGFHH